MRSSASLSSLLILTFVLITSGCETTDQALTAAERVVKSRTGQTVIDLAGGKDPAQIAKKRLDQYTRDPNALLRDLRDAQKDFETILAVLGVNIGKTWGKEYTLRSMLNSIRLDTESLSQPFAKIRQTCPQQPSRIFAISRSLVKKLPIAGSGYHACARLCYVRGRRNRARSNLTA
jgi:hypothetical protein